MNSFDWDSKPHNSDAYWVTYVLGAFQELPTFDNDARTEGETRARSNLTFGGSVIYIETTRDSSVERGWDPTLKQQDAAVHEIGHTVGNSAVHPVTRFEQDGMTYSRYTEDYLLKIRSSTKPAG